MSAIMYEALESPRMQAAECERHAAQGKGGLYYAGAWCGYGFHEDGLKAGMAAAAALGAKFPWMPRATSPKMSLADMFFLSTFDKFARRAITLGHLRFILPNGEELVYGGAASAARSLPKGDPWRSIPHLHGFGRCVHYKHA